MEWNGHMVAVDIFPAGIDPDVLEHTMEQPQVKKRVEELKKMVCVNALLHRWSYKAVLFRV